MEFKPSRPGFCWTLKAFSYSEKTEPGLWEIKATKASVQHLEKLLGGHFVGSKPPWEMSSGDIIFDAIFWAAFSLRGA
jgi:hypothetical protein